MPTSYLGPVLVYSHRCPYCRSAVAILSRLPGYRDIEYVPIESDHGRQLVVDHHGFYVHAPHLFADSRVYYGVGPVLRRLAHIPNL